MAFTSHLRSLSSASFSSCALFFLLSMMSPATVLAQAPGEVSNLLFSDALTLGWDTARGADFFNLYRVDLAGLAAGGALRCHGFEIAGTSFSTSTPADPESGEGFIYLATAESKASGEGTPGTGTGGVPRELLGACSAVMRAHVLDRTGNGWSEWSSDRLAKLGRQGYIDEQLNPSTIDESRNTDLNNRLALYDPPKSFIELVGRQTVVSVYSRRQLEQRVALFWTNHLNTYWVKTAQLFRKFYPECVGENPSECDPAFPTVADREATNAQFREFEEFRDLAFNGNFRQILEASARSAAMILYLDSYVSLVGQPNENYSRELLELYTMGVDGGYTQTDVEELARILTGWIICKKELADLDDPLAPCIADYYLPTPAGAWASAFDLDRHDCGAKTLFAGTPQEVVFPATSCTIEQEGIDEFNLALDSIVAHPSTPCFISRKILQLLVTDDPDEAMIDSLVAVWNDGENPHGVGDLRELLRAALKIDAFFDPDMARSKIKSPFEQFTGALRALRGTTDGRTTIFEYLINAQHVPHFNAVPTGYSELGDDWLDTNNTLARQNFAIQLALGSDPAFGSDPLALLNDHGISTAPGNGEAIVGFLAEILFGGAFSTAERQAALEFLSTNDLGLPSPYDEASIRKLTAFLLGHAQYQEQ